MQVGNGERDELGERAVPADDAEDGPPRLVVPREDALLLLAVREGGERDRAVGPAVDVGDDAGAEPRGRSGGTRGRGAAAAAFAAAAAALVALAAHLDHLSDELVPEHSLESRDVPPDDLEVRGADAGAEDADGGLPRRGRRGRHGAVNEDRALGGALRILRAGEDERLHFA